MSTAMRSAVFCACSARCAFSSRHACQGPAKNVARPATSSSVAFVTASRNQRSCATRITPASSDCSSRSSHSRLATSRWFVGSSSRIRSGSPLSARASEARVSSPPENVVERTVEVDLREAEPAHDRVRALAPRVAAGVLEPGLRLAVAPERRRVVRARAHRLLQPPQLLLRRDQVARAREDVLAERERPVERRPLVVQRDARPLLERELAAVQLGLAREEPEQGRLAGPVRAGERDAVAALDLEGDAVEEDVSAELLLEVGCDDHCHRV